MEQGGFSTISRVLSSKLARNPWEETIHATFLYCKYCQPQEKELRVDIKRS